MNEGASRSASIAIWWAAVIRRPSGESIGSALISSRHWFRRSGWQTVNIGHRSAALTT